MLRLILGLGESVAFPCSSKMLAENVSVTRRGRSNGDIAIGLALGPAFGTYVGGMILARYGWRVLFISLGALSLLWLIPWLTGPARTLPVRRVESAESGPAFLDIIRKRAALGAGLGHFCANYIFYFVLAWLPYYLVDVRGYSLTRMATIGGLTYVMHAVGAWCTGFVVDRRIERGESPHRVYANTLVVSHIASAVCLVGVLLGGPQPARGEPARSGIHFRPRVANAVRGGAACSRDRRRRGGGSDFRARSEISRALPVRRSPDFSSIARGVSTVRSDWRSAVSLIGVLAWTVVIPRIEQVRWELAMAT